LVVQPVAAGTSAAVAQALNVAFALVYLYVILVIFTGRRDRIIAVSLFVPVIGSNFAVYAVPARLAMAAGAVFHCAVLAFLGFAVVSTLQRLFARSVIRGDDVFAAVCGYLLGGMAWGHVYALAYLVKPESFGMSDAVAAQLKEPHLRHALFNYFSFTTLTSIGFSDITPVGPTVHSLVWTEVMFGQFYMAVVVAQIVGLKLAQALARDDGPRP
jgi:ion channel